MDVVVTMPAADVQHLNKKIRFAERNQSAWWDFGRVPKKLDPESKVFVVCGGEVLGYFSTLFIRGKRVYLGKWRSIQPIPMKGFQGFRYRKFDYEELRGSAV